MVVPIVRLVVAPRLLSQIPQYIANGYASRVRGKGSVSSLAREVFFLRTEILCSERGRGCPKKEQSERQM